eukprot:6637584-Alexandrium_andersonii.AAC.1
MPPWGPPNWRMPPWGPPNWRKSPWGPPNVREGLDAIVGVGIDVEVRRGLDPRHPPRPCRSTSRRGR